MCQQSRYMIRGTAITEQHPARGYPCAGFRVKKRLSLILFGSSITLAILATFSDRQVRATCLGRTDTVASFNAM